MPLCIYTLPMHTDIYIYLPIEEGEGRQRRERDTEEEERSWERTTHGRAEKEPGRLDWSKAKQLQGKK